MKKPFIFLLHLGFWLAYLLLVMVLLYGLLSGEEDLKELDDEVLTTAFFMLILLPSVGTFYGAYLFLFPRFFRPGNYLLTQVYGLAWAATLTCLGWLSLRFVFYPECVQDAGEESFLAVWGLSTAVSVLCGVVAFVLRGFFTWFEEVKIKEALLAKNQEMELALVKARLDPHFLFNTLNNIDVLILKDPATASDYLNRLSDIMRFTLYETRGRSIPLDRELAYIEKYVALQRIRTANVNYVELLLPGQNQGYTIAPMVFIPFLENAFKHSPNKKVAAAIRIAITVNEGNIHFSCHNKTAPERLNGKADGGLGLDLIRKRLHLLYPDLHQLTIERTMEEFRVNLILNAT